MKPYAQRDDRGFLAEMIALTRHHLDACPEYSRIHPRWSDAGSVAELPYLHAGVFKHIVLRSSSEAGRVLESSSTTGNQPSRIVLDRSSSEHQQQSAQAILEDYLGPLRYPLLVLDQAASLRSRNVPARVAAAFSLQSLSTDMHFVLDDAGEIKREILDTADEFLVYGLTYLLWQNWRPTPDKRIHFVHSGGWKKMEALRIERVEFEQRLLDFSAPGSTVLDYYGLVEQPGVIYPLCRSGFRHVPVWADVLVRDPRSHALTEDAGQLQLMNTLARSAPYHSVLTEDVGCIKPGYCDCGRVGKRFELLGRLPQAELRGCANV